MAASGIGEEIASLVAPFSAVSRGRYQRAVAWRAATGGKVIGCVPMYVPEELVHAAGMLPVTLLGADETITIGDRHVQPYLSCGVMRSNLDIALKGRLDFLDGAIFPDICEPPERIGEIWAMKLSKPFHYSYMLPISGSSPITRQYLLEENGFLKAELERLGAPITEAALRRSVAIYNQNRLLLERLYELRRRPGFPLRSHQVYDIVLASMLMPKEEHNELLARLLASLEMIGPGSQNGDSPRILLSGYTCDRPESYVLDFVEGLGAIIVDDDLYVGRRYFHGLAPETVVAIEALVERYFAGLPCVTKRGAGWADHIVAMARDARADGVLIMALKYCDPLAFEYPQLKRVLKEAEVPMLWIDVEDRGGASDQVRNRLQAFVELVRAHREGS